MRVLSFDAETNGLYGKAFTLAAVVTDDPPRFILPDSLSRSSNVAQWAQETMTPPTLLASFVARCPIEGPVNQWVADNVLPQIEDIAITHGSYAEMVEAFYRFYMGHRDEARTIVHVPYPVETTILRDMIIADIDARIWHGPFPLVDVASVLLASGYAEASVDAYNASHRITIPCAAGNHHPLYDSWAAERCFRHLMTS